MIFEIVGQQSFRYFHRPYKDSKYIYLNLDRSCLYQEKFDGRRFQ